MRITASVEHIDRTEKAVKEIDRAVSDSLHESAVALLAQIQGKTPVKSGALLRSERIETVDAHNKEIIIGGRGVDYAEPVERRRGFATSTADSFQSRFENTVAKALKRVVGGS